MNSSIYKEVVGNKIILAAIGVAALIAVGSGVYYIVSTRVPTNTPPLPAMASSTEVVTGNGVVEPAQNPTLAFESGGRVARVAVAVGDSVSQGEVLASLDTSSLQASLNQAQANVAAQQANLAQMQAGPRQVDVQAKQTGVDQANTSLQNLYASVPAQLSQAYDKSFSGVSADTDTLFGQPDSAFPTLAFSTSNTQASTNAINARTAVNSELANWANEETSFSASTSPASINTELSTSIDHLQVIRSYSDTLLVALGSAISNGNFSQAQIAAAQTAVGNLRDDTNTLILSLQSEQQQIASAELAVTSAQDALNQVEAGSTPQEIAAQQAQVDAAQAQVESVNAQIQQAIVVAPFSGTVASVEVKAGQIVAANTDAISLNPRSALQIEVYVSEVDAAKLTAGDAADVTLDAYGTGRHFNASVVSIDTAPTLQNGIPGYKVVLQFAQADPAITTGMTANVTITPTNQ